VLTLRELNRALLARQLLLARVRIGVPRAVERLCALQAQYSPSPYIALWSRIEGFRKERLTRALERRQVVKATLFRTTLHIVSERDFPAFASVWHGGRDPRLAAANTDLDELRRRIRERAEAAPITHEDLQRLVAPHIQGWVARRLVPLVHIPPSGTWRYHGPIQMTTSQAWLGSPVAEPSDGAATFVRRYLAAFGPASQDDLLRFGNFRLIDVKSGLDALEPKLRRFRDEAGRLLLDVERGPLPPADTEAPVRFLPKWDSALLAYAPPERARILPEPFRKRVIAVNGDVAQTVLVDGFVAALWSVEKGGLKIEPLRRLTRDERAAMDDEGERLLEFLRD